MSGHSKWKMDKMLQLSQNLTQVAKRNPAVGYSWKLHLKRSQELWKSRAGGKGHPVHTNTSEAGAAVLVSET